MLRTIAVLAGSINQYQDFLRANFTQVRLGKIRYIHLESPDMIRGIRISGVEVIGNFWQKSNAKELHDFAMRELEFHNPSKKKV